MMKLEKDIRGIPLWLLHEYLQELGGQADGENRVVADGWAARLTQLDDFRVGSLVVGQVRLEIESEQRALEALAPLLEKKLLRGGG